MSEAVATKEFEAGLSLLHMMQVPSDATGSGSDSAAARAPSASAKKKRQDGAGGASTPRPAKKARVKAVGTLLLAAAQQVDPTDREYAVGPEIEDDDEDDDGSESGADENNGTLRGEVRRNVQLNTLTRELDIDELREHFNKPIVDVAKEFGICTTFLKKICRRCGIKRWPHRQIRSLTRTIEMLRQAEANATSVQEKAKYASQIAHVEAKMRAVIEDPDANGKLERVKKSVLNRSGSPGSWQSSVDATSRTKSAVATVSQGAVVQADLLQAVAAAAAVADSEASHTPEDETSPTLRLKAAALTTSEAEAAAAEALLFSASPRTPIASIDVHVPPVDLASDALPAMTPTAGSTPELTPQQGLKISPSHRKQLAAPKSDGEHRVRTSSLGSLKDLEAVGESNESAEAPTTPESSLPSTLPSTVAVVEAS